MTSNTNRLTLLFIFILLSCSQDQKIDLKAEFESLPIADLELISEFDHAGDYFFQHLNYSSVALPDGDILLNDREGSYIIRVNSQGQLVDLIAQKGNGPGEVQDPMSVEMIDDSTILIVDQQRQRIIRKTLDSSNIDEFAVPRTETTRVNEAFATSRPDVISMIWWDFSVLNRQNADPVSKISSYNLVSDEIIQEIVYPGDTYALLQIGGQTRGATKVPFTPTLMYDNTIDKTELYVFWPEEPHITVLDPIRFDTLKTIPVRLISEPLSSAERDSLEGEYQPAQWETVDELLPEQKVPAHQMIIDSQNRIWLQLTLHSDKQEWIVLDQTGSPQFRVQFPREGMVTHISENHIGFRADDHLFSLYALSE
ncbi:hypothetical protein [Rhodohalobacter sp. 8-1]|uniref:hypothetical protein n=1 Tax=Rhodohalobacter sp. 8-1 TaxID=3131972 RepID=UPI0030EE99AC